MVKEYQEKICYVMSFIRNSVVDKITGESDGQKLIDFIDGIGIAASSLNDMIIHELVDFESLNDLRLVNKVIYFYKKSLLPIVANKVANDLNRLLSSNFWKNILITRCGFDPKIYGKIDAYNRILLADGIEKINEGISEILKFFERIERERIQMLISVSLIHFGYIKMSVDKLLGMMSDEGITEDVLITHINNLIDDFIYLISKYFSIWPSSKIDKDYYQRIVSDITTEKISLFKFLELSIIRNQHKIDPFNACKREFEINDSIISLKDYVLYINEAVERRVHFHEVA